MQQPERLSTRALIGYGLAASPVIYSYVLILVMYMKYATVELGVTPAVVGSIFFFAKLWDAVTDPMIGNLSDRTQLATGRRRPWLLASAPLLALFTIMAWAPPESLEGHALIGWITVSVLGFYTAYTVFEVPHMALGAELSLEAPERNRIFGFRQIMKVLGMLAAGVGGSYVIGLGTDATRIMAHVVGGLTLGLIVSGVSMLPPERSEFQGRGGTNPFRALRDVLSNPHARLLLLVLFIDAIGTGGIGVLTPFVLDYVAHRPKLIPVMFGVNLLSTLGAVPVWLSLAKRFEKRHLVQASMFGSGIGYGLILLVSEERWWIVAVCGLIAGFCSSAPNTLGYTLKSEIIDCDELDTGERKEGAYFAGWSFVNKLAAGLMIGITGWALTWSGFDGAAEQQTVFVEKTMLVLMGGVPLICYLLGALIFFQFRLTEADHAEIRNQLDARIAENPNA